MREREQRGLWIVQGLLALTFTGTGVWKLAPVAQLSCALLMASAIVFHLSRGEAANTPFNFRLLGLSLFAAWGRRVKAPLAPRG